MAKTPAVVSTYQKKSHGDSCCMVTGPDGHRKEVHLGSDKRKADEVRAALMANAKNQTLGDYPVRDLCNLFMDSITNSPEHRATAPSRPGDRNQRIAAGERSWVY